MNRNVNLSVKPGVKTAVKTAVKTEGKSQAEEVPGLSSSFIFLLALAIGVTVANLYYAQPLAILISHDLGLSSELAGLVVTLTQLGYGIGVFCAVPLGDMVENRRLILALCLTTIIGLLILIFSREMVSYFASAFIIGLGASSVQVMVPFAAHFVPAENRGHTVGKLMSGLMTGIMLSRPLASVASELSGWHAVFLISLVMMSAIFILLYWRLPTRTPSPAEITYPTLLLSMVQIFLATPVLRRRSFYQAMLFGTFCLFWTAVPLYLGGPEFKFSQSAIAVFALVGVTGAVSAPFAGRAADRGWTQPATFTAIAVCVVSYLLGLIFAAGTIPALAALVVSAILLDAGITANLILGQRAIFLLQPELRSRLNGLYIASIFGGGSLGSALGAWSFSRGGWPLASRMGICLPLVALAFFIIDTWILRRKRDGQNI